MAFPPRSCQPWPTLPNGHARSPGRLNHRGSHQHWHPPSAIDAIGYAVNLAFNAAEAVLVRSSVSRREALE
jgi:hypothetical protein